MVKNLRTLFLFLLAAIQLAGAVTVSFHDITVNKKCDSSCSCGSSCDCAHKKAASVPFPDQVQSKLSEQTVQIDIAKCSESIELQLATNHERPHNFPACIESIYANSPPAEFHLPLRI